MMVSINLDWKTVGVDFTWLALGGSFLLVLNFAINPFRRGFYCNDDTIRYPDHSSTIPTWLLAVYCLVIPMGVIFATEFLKHRPDRKSIKFLCSSAPVWLAHLYQSILIFLFGCLAAQVPTDIGKLTIGRLRPNFIDVCAPSINLLNCTGNEYKYIEDYVCTKASDDARESRLSFPSGHASFSVYAMLYTGIYIQQNWDFNKGGKLIRLSSFLQLSLLLLSYFTSLSRVMNNKHHWSDILAGSVIGVLAATLTARYVPSFIGGRLVENKYDDADAELKNVSST